jgi:hypothetical protein
MLFSGIHGSSEDIMSPTKMEPHNGPVFAHTHIGIPNPHPIPRQALKGSDSSFEDLEKECMELSTKSY